MPGLGPADGTRRVWPRDRLGAPGASPRRRRWQLCSRALLLVPHISLTRGPGQTELYFRTFVHYLSLEFGMLGLRVN